MDLEHSGPSALPADCSNKLTSLRARLQRTAQRHPELTLDRLRRLEARCLQAGEAAAAIDLLCQRFVLLERSGRALELAEELRQAAAKAQAAGWPAQGAEVAEALGRIAYQQGNYLDATEHWSRALDLADSAQAARVSVAARIGLGQVHYAMRAWNSGLRFHRDALARLRSLEDDYLAAKVALNIGVGHFESGQQADAERHFAHGLAAARRGGHREFEAEAHWHLARAALARKQLPVATADCRLALALAARLHHHWLEAAASRTWTEIALARGDEADAIRSTQHGLALAERIESKPQQSQAHLQLARLLDRQGDARSALAHLWRHVELQAEFERQTLSTRMELFPNADGVPTGADQAQPPKSPSAL